FPADYFRPTLTHRDSRLPMFEPILAVSLPAMEEDAAPAEAVWPANRSRALYRAYPVQAFKKKTGVIDDVIGEAPIAVLFLANTETMTAVSRVLDGRTLTLEERNGPRAEPAFYDQETGTRWNVEGRGEEGPLAGRQLRRVDSHLSQWYGWVSYFPQTTIY